jgi:hypothetical protein
MYRRPEHYVSPASRGGGAAYIPRLKAVELPCPAAVPPRTAAIIAGGVGTLIYMIWAGVLLKGYNSECWPGEDGGEREKEAVLELTTRVSTTGLRAIALLSTGVGFIEVNSTTKYANFSFYFAATATVLQFATLVACIFPQRDVLKNLSRVNWVSGTPSEVWLVTDDPERGGTERPREEGRRTPS